jgi:hypothetical protein
MNYMLIRTQNVLSCPVTDCSVSVPDGRGLVRHVRSAHQLKKVSCYIVEEYRPDVSHNTNDNTSKRIPGGVQRSPISKRRASGPYPPRSLSITKEDSTSSSTLDFTHSTSAGPSEQDHFSLAPIISNSPPLVLLQEQSLEELHHLDGTQTYLESDKILSVLSLRIHKYFKTLHCMICNLAIPPTSMPQHIHKKHGRTLNKEENSHLAEALSKHQVRNGTDVPKPAPGGPPVEGLALHLNGYACIACDICHHNFLTFQNHWSKEHKDIALPAKKGFKMATLQTFFARPSVFFQVNPALATLSKSDPFHIYITKEVPKIETTTIIPPPTSFKEVPPLLQAMGWHLHLADYITDKHKIRDLMALKQLPSIYDKSSLGQLRTVVLNYMEEVSKLGHQSPFGVRCILMEWPRFVF